MTIYITAVSPTGEMNYYDAETWEDAYEQAKAEFGNGVTIRESWYKEWVCGVYANTPETGECWWTIDGRHVWRDGIDCDSCGHNFRPELIVNHGNGEKFCLDCQ